jgi:hypothetical protein
VNSQQLIAGNFIRANVVKILVERGVCQVTLNGGHALRAFWVLWAHVVFVAVVVGKKGRGHNTLAAPLVYCIFFIISGKNWLRFFFGLTLTLVKIAPIDVLH